MNGNSAAIVSIFVLLGLGGLFSTYFAIQYLRHGKAQAKQRLRNSNHSNVQFELPLDNVTVKNRNSILGGENNSG